MKLQEVTAYNLKTQHILTEGWDTLTESQRIYLGKAERELWPLMEQLTKVFEAELTTDQIQTIFQGAEDQAMSSGKNKTALGKAGQVAKLPVDAMKAVNAKVNELGKMAQNTGPVKNMDAKFEELKKKIGTSDGKIVQAVKAVSDWAKENPGKASLAVAILTAAAAFAGGPVGGAAVGFLLRSTKDLLQGEKLSTAAGKAAKTAAVGALAGAAFNYIGDAVIGNIEAGGQAAIDATADSLENANIADALAGVGEEYADVVPTLEGGWSQLQISGNINAYNYNFNVVLAGDDLSTYETLKNAVVSAKDATDSFSPETLNATAKLHDFLGSVQASDSQDTMRSAIAAIKQAKEVGLTSEQLTELVGQTEDLEAFVAGATKGVEGAAPVIQGAVQQANDFEKEAVKAGKPPKQMELPLEEPAETFDYKEYLHDKLLEADPVQQELPLDNPNTMGAKAKRGLGNLASKVGAAAKGAVQGAGAGIAKGASKAVAGVKQGAKDVGNKVTANKLNKDWQKMGSPTDTGSVVNVLSNAGLSNDDIATIGSSASVDLPVPTTSDEPATDTTEPTEKQPGADAEATPGAKAKQQTANKVEKGTKADGSDGDPYTWKGGQWINDKTGRVAKRDVGKELTTNASAPEDAEAVPSDGGTAGADPTATPTAEPTATPTAEPTATPTATPGATPTAKPTAGGTDKTVNDLANAITKAGVGELVKTQIQGGGASADASAGGEINLADLASDLSDAGVQQIARDQLVKQQTADYMT